MSIETETMVIGLQIGAWTGHRTDKQAAAELTEAKNADHDAARVNKHLVPKQMLAPITAASQALRRHLYTYTLPWRDNGDRLLPRTIYMPFMDRFGELKDAFDGCVRQFIEHDYPQARDRAAFRMGKLFNPDDYPSERSLRRRFYVTLDVQPVALADDFRVDIGKREVAKVKQTLEQATEARIQRATQDIWERLANVLEHFHERLSGDGRFRTSTLDNVKELVALVPGLNFAKDADLAEIAHRIRITIGTADADALRKEDDYKARVLAETSEIMASMRGFMRAFQTQEDEDNE